MSCVFEVAENLIINLKGKVLVISSLKYKLDIIEFMAGDQDHLIS